MKKENRTYNQIIIAYSKSGIRKSVLHFMNHLRMMVMEKQVSFTWSRKENDYNIYETWQIEKKPDPTNKEIIDINFDLLKTYAAKTFTTDNAIFPMLFIYDVTYIPDYNITEGTDPKRLIVIKCDLVSCIEDPVVYIAPSRNVMMLEGLWMKKKGVPKQMVTKYQKQIYSFLGSLYDQEVDLIDTRVRKG